MWLAVIARSLAFLCLHQVEGKDPKKYDTVLKRVSFLESLGLSREDAALAVGSSKASVDELYRRKEKGGGSGGGKKKKK
jgi:hypothetical protein